MVLNYASEKAYIFDHSWRQFKQKLIFPDLQKVDWDYYYSAYRKFLPSINNNYDFAEMLSELLGELNASHTGARYRDRPKNPDSTASLGAIYDEYDQPAPPPPAGTTPLLDGAMPVTDFNDTYDATLDDTAYTTLGGFLFGELGRLPRTGDRVTTGGWTFEISEMDGRRVKGVLLVGRETVKSEQ